MNWSGGSPGIVTPLTQAHKSCCIPFTNALSPYIDDANAVWSGTTITRYNSAFIRFTAWAGTCSFELQTTPSGEADIYFGVVQNGSLLKTVTNAEGTGKRKVDITGFTPGQTYELWESRQNAVNTGSGVNSGIDVPHSQGYITGIYSPPGWPLPTPVICTSGIIVLTMSIGNYVTDATPSCFYSPLGQLRKLAHQQGKLVGDLTYGAGTFCGDAFTPSQRADDVYRLYVAMGSPATLKIYVDDVRNDYSYYNLHGVGTSPTTWTTQIQSFRTAVLALIPQATFYINTTIGQTTESANPGGYTLPDYRTAVAGLSGWTIISGTALNITSPTYRDDVHLTQAGSTRYVLGPNSNDGVAQALGLA